MPEPLTLRALIARAGAGRREISTRDHLIRLADLASGSAFGMERRRLRGRSVVLNVRDMAMAAAALIDLDGRARRVFLCPPGFDGGKLADAARLIEADAHVHDEGATALPTPVQLTARLPLSPSDDETSPTWETEWVLPTSGTSGAPKLAVHTLSTLVGALGPTPLQEWATFYDIRRYGGLQIFLRALMGQGSLRLSGPDEPIEQFLERLGVAGITHISGTPTHWRKALLSGAASRISPSYVRLSGEIADASILSGVAAAYPAARVEHAYASTEAGVVGVVDDVQPGFPAQWLERSGPVEMRIVDGALQVKSPGRALRLLGDGAPTLVDAEGFVDTGDMIALRGDRCHFLGRRGGVINVGGAKVHPEEVEAALMALEGVRAARAFAKPSPIMGAIVAAEVVLSEGVAGGLERERELVAAARRKLPAHMAPARIRVVDELPMTEAGKLKRYG